MKKIYTIIIAAGLFISGTTLWVPFSSGFAQTPASLKFSSDQKYQVRTPSPDGRSGMHDHISLFNNKQTDQQPSTLIHRPSIPAPQPFKLIALTDSFYDWSLNRTAMVWGISGKGVDFVYDSNLNLTSYIYKEDWNGTTWDYVTKCTYTYDANNNMTSELYQEWNSTAWDNNYRYTYTYDANNNMITRIDQGWNGTWFYNGKFSMTYDANNNRTSELYQFWSSGNAWNNNVRYTYTYDINNNKKIGITESWSNNVWDTVSQYTYTYDANNNMIIQLGQNWKSKIWDSKILYSYDVKNNKTSALEQRWKDTTWVTIARYNYTYDSNSFITSEMFKAFNSADTNEIIEGDSTYYYFHVVNGVNELNNSLSISVFPNPSDGRFFIDSKINKGQISVYNVFGEMILSQNIHHPEPEINISLFPKGLYFIEINGKDSRYFTKVIKQ